MLAVLTLALKAEPRSMLAVVRLALKAEPRSTMLAVLKLACAMLAVLYTGVESGTS